MVLMFDELATEKRIRWDPKTNCFLGLCRVLGDAPHCYDFEQFRLYSRDCNSGSASGSLKAEPKECLTGKGQVLSKGLRAERISRWLTSILLLIKIV